jgi:sulfate transport system substrate-binding protein
MRSYLLSHKLHFKSYRAAAGSILAATLTLTLTLTACGGSADTTSSSGPSSASGSSSSSSSSSAPAASGSTQLALVAYSTPQAAYAELIPAFEHTTAAGKGSTFTESFGASGAQSRAVDTGLPADVVAFSTTPDITRLVKDGIVAKTWDANPYKGVVADSVVVIVVRKGNPKHISGWDDLIKPAVKVITPNPSTSGSARWNILAAYGAELKLGKTPAQALAYVRTLLTRNVTDQPSSASAALQAFTSGEGDVLLDYESDALAAQKAGDAVQYIVPPQTILIQTPIAVTTKSAHAAAAQSFVNWLWSEQAQTIWAQEGYRPVRKAVQAVYARKFPTPAGMFTISDLGGWTKVSKALFAPSTGSITKIEAAAGVPTASS